MTRKIKVRKELYELYIQKYKGDWGTMIRDWRRWMNCDLNNSDDEKLKEELFDEISWSPMVPSDIIPLLITGEIEIVEKQEPRKWRVYYEQEPEFLTFRYTFWNGRSINQTNEIDEIPFLTTEETTKAPLFMKSLAKKEK